MAKVIYGTEGIKQKDYRVYVGLSNNTTLQSTIDTYLASPTQANLNTLLDEQGGQSDNKLQELGECRADSIDMGVAEGDSIDGNILGKIVLNKTGTFTAELLNATPANIAALELLDGQICTVLMLERDTHQVDVSGTMKPHKTAILMNKINLSYTEKITGSDSVRSTVTFEKSVPSAGSFRAIADLEQLS